ncbi:MAG TPA: transcription antitermination factor NusB [Anaerolineales bacterium]|nr:transcription antitermination factor NusB [Anaerolineales bacterium]
MPELSNSTTMDGTAERLRPRRQARCLALTVLYELDCTTHELGETFANQAQDSELSRSLLEFSRQLVSGIRMSQTILDKAIEEHAPEWPFDQIAIVDRNILRLALFEMLNVRSTPTKVAINEAIELAKLYGSDTAPRFVNGVLGALSEELGSIRTRLQSINIMPVELAGEVVA